MNAKRLMVPQAIINSVIVTSA